MLWLKAVFTSRWLDRKTISELGVRCFTRERSDRTAKLRNTNIDLSLKRSGRSKGCVNPDAFGVGSDCSIRLAKES